jgi:hypothetical protein
MAGVRIRWRGVARVAALVVVGLVVLRLLPGLLRAPEPPPLAADVGLPQAKPVRVVEQPRPPHRRRIPERPRPDPRPVPDGPAATAVIGTRHKRRIRRTAGHHSLRQGAVESKPVPEPKATVESIPPPLPERVPPPPEPVAEPLPEPAPAPPTTPGDGSEEFAPH